HRPGALASRGDRARHAPGRRRRRRRRHPRPRRRERARRPLRQRRRRSRRARGGTGSEPQGSAGPRRPRPSARSHHPGRRGPGAALATAGIFLPSFVLVALSSPLLPRLRRSAAAGFLDGARAASVALMAVVTWQLGRAAVVDVPAALLALAAGALVFGTRLNSAWLVAGGAFAGGL